MKNIGGQDKLYHRYENDLERINYEAEHNASAFIARTEAAFHRDIRRIAETIASSTDLCKVIMLAGPSSSGKTTTAHASELWHEVYKRYYPAKQLDTLVEELQSADAIEADIDNDVNYFLVFLGGKLIGYFAWKMENTALHLMHLYLKPEYRGKAIGRDIVQTCERLAKGEGKGRVWCTIHAKALPVQQFFKALRYRELRPAEQETGTVPRNELVYEHTLS